MSTNCGNCGHGIMEHTVPSHCFREKCYCEKYVIPGPEDKFPYGYPQKAMSQKCQCTHDREDHGFYFIDGACHNTACNCKRYNPAPQEAPEAKSNCRICPKCNRIFVEYGDPQCPFCLSPVSHPCTPEASIRAAASKMAEALKLAQELLERNGVHRPEIDAVLAMYYKVGGK